MKQKIQEAIPNAITMSRMILSIALLFVTPWSLPFCLVYITCGMTDLMDGFLARLWKTQSQIGAKLDSIADVMFLVCILYRIGPELWIKLCSWKLLCIVVCCIFAIKMIAAIIGFLRFHVFTFLHTYLNKCMGVILFFVILFLNQMNIPLYIAVVDLSFLAAMEEFVIQVNSKELNLNVKSICSLR